MARVSINDTFLEKLQSLLGDANPARVTEDALTLLNWAANEVKAGRTIVSTDATGGDVHKLAMPALSKVAK